MNESLISNLLDSIKARLVAANPDGVSIDYTFRRDLGTVNGRFVNVFLMRATKSGAASRVEDFFDVVVGLVNGYRYPDRATPPREWVENRIKDELTKVYHVLTSARAEVFTGGFWPQVDDMPSIVSHEMLEEKKTYWAEMEVTFRTVISDDLIQTSWSS